jgi:hypothetical protein
VAVAGVECDEPATRLDRVAECIRVLKHSLVHQQAIDLEDVLPSLDGALRELALTRRVLEGRLTATGSNGAKLRAIDAALADLEEFLKMVQTRAASIAISRISSGRSHRRQSRTRTGAAMLGALAAGVGIAASSLPAAAEPSYVGMTAANVGVMDRARPEYDPKGVPMGAFRLFPSMDVNASYDSNVYLQPSGTAADVSDFRFEETPSLRLMSQWGRHFVEIYGGLDNLNYSKYSALDLTDWVVGGDGRLDISRAMDWSIAGSYGEYHEVLSSPSASATVSTLGFPASPNRYYKGHVDTVARFQPNRLGISAGASYDRYDWNSTPTLGGGTLFNTDRNESEYQGFVKVNYDFSPGYSGYIKGLYDSRQFDLALDRNGVDRSSHGYHIDAGLNFQVSHLLAGELFVGYLDQSFQAPLLDVSGFDYGMKIDWYATPVLTVHLTGSRTINDVTLAGVSAGDDKLVKISADYELRRNVILQGYLSYTDSTLKSFAVPTTRHDTYPGAGVALKYLMNRYMSAHLNYNYNERSSNFAGVDYSDSTVSLGLSLHI